MPGRARRLSVHPTFSAPTTLTGTTTYQAAISTTPSQGPVRPNRQVHHEADGQGDPGPQADRAAGRCVRVRVNKKRLGVKGMEGGERRRTYFLLVGAR